MAQRPDVEAAYALAATIWAVCQIHPYIVHSVEVSEVTRASRDLQYMAGEVMAAMTMGMTTYHHDTNLTVGLGMINQLFKHRNSSLAKIRRRAEPSL